MDNAVGSTFGAPLKSKALSRHDKITESLRRGYNIIKVSIPSFHKTDDLVVYEVDVSNKKLRWNLWLRYEFFYVLHQMMQDLVTELSTAENRIILPPFPEKRIKIFTDHFNEHFLENRRILLDNYLQRVLQNRYLRHSEIFISFLTPPNNETIERNYSLNTNNEQIQNNQNNQNNNNEENEKKEEKENELKHEEEEEKKQENIIEKQEMDKTQSSIDRNLTLNKLCCNVEGIDESDEITGVEIPQAQILKNDHTIYQIHVRNVNKRKSFAEWTVLKRFGEFHTFNDELRSAMINDYPNELSILPPLPPKYVKVLVDHLEQTFIEKRRLLLQCYLQRLIRYPILRRHELVLRFLGVYNQ